MTEPYELVSNPDYFRDVLHNMRGPKHQAIVRFGRKSSGHSPNYQVEKDKTVRRYSGQNHKEYHDDPDQSFADENLSPPLSYAVVQQLLARLL